MHFLLYSYRVLCKLHCMHVAALNLCCIVAGILCCILYSCCFSVRRARGWLCTRVHSWYALCSSRVHAQSRPMQPMRGSCCTARSPEATAGASLYKQVYLYIYCTRIYAMVYLYMLVFLICTRKNTNYFQLTMFYFQPAVHMYDDIFSSVTVLL